MSVPAEASGPAASDPLPQQTAASEAAPQAVTEAETGAETRGDAHAAESTGEVRPSWRGGRALLVVLGCLSAIGPLSIDTYLPALPAITSELLTGPAQVQLTLTACLIGVSIGQVVSGPLSDVLGRKRPLLAGMAGYTLASLLCAFAPTVQALIALRLLQGFTGGAALVVVRAIARDLYGGPALARIFATIMLVSGLAPILAPIAGAQLLNITSWRGIFLALGLLGVAMLVAVLAGVRETLPSAARQAGGLRRSVVSFGRLLREPSFMACGLAAGFGFGGMFLYISGSPFLLQEVYGVSPQTYSLVFGLNAFGLIAAAQTSGRLSGRVRPELLVVFGSLLTLAGASFLLVAVLAGMALPAVVVALFVAMCGAGFVMPGSGALALASQPSQVAGSASALLGVVQFAFGGLTAPLMGLFGGGSAAPMAAMWVTASFLGLAAFVLLRRLGGRRSVSAG